MREIKSIHKNNLCHKNLSLRFFSLSLLSSQFFMLCGLSFSLWHKPLLERPSHCTPLSLCVQRVCLCKLVRSHHIPPQPFLSSSFDKLTCIGGLFTAPSRSRPTSRYAGTGKPLCLPNHIHSKGLGVCHELRMPLGLNMELALLCVAEP